MSDASSEALQKSRGASVRSTLARSLDVLSLILIVLAAWRLLAGGAHLSIGAVRIVTMHDVFRPLRALGAILFIRHLLFGPRGLPARILAPVLEGLTAPLRGPGRGIALLAILGAVSGAVRGSVHLISTRHLEVTIPLRSKTIVLDALRDGVWGLGAGLAAGVLVWALCALIDRVAPVDRTAPAPGGASPEHERPAWRERRALLACADFFIITATFGPWARLDRWELAPTPLNVSPGLIAALLALALLGGLVMLSRLVARGGVARRLAAGAIGAIVVGFVGAAAWSLNPPSRASDHGADDRSSRDRVLLVTIDTLRADHLGCYGYAKPTSPEIDALAAMGTRFDRAYCTMPNTDPSHTSILTGVYPRAHGVLRNGGEIVVGERIAHMPEYMKRRGFTTAAITSRRHLHPRELGIRGFDYYSVPLTEERVPADDTLERALRWLDVHGHESYFLWVHFFDPHFPYDPPPEFARRFVGEYHGTIDRGNNYTAEKYSEAEVPYLSGLYDGEIAFASSAVGKLVEAIQRDSDPGHPPLIVITADHGESLGEFRKKYGYVFAHGEYLPEAQVRVPLIVVQRGRVPAGRVVRSVVENFSVAPTIASFARTLPAAGGGGGERYVSEAPDLWPLIDAPEAEKMERETEGPAAFIQRRYYEEPPKPYHRAEECAIATGAWKLVYNPLRGGELYDLLADPAEARNVASDRPDLVTTFTRRLERWKADHPIPAQAFGKISPEKLEELRGLGYVR